MAKEVDIGHQTLSFNSVKINLNSPELIVREGLIEIFEVQMVRTEGGIIAMEFEIDSFSRVMKWISGPQEEDK